MSVEVSRRTDSVRLLSNLAQLALLSILLAGAAAWCLDGNRWRKPLEGLTWFRIKEVKIQSEWPLTPAEIRALLPPLQGKNLLLVPPVDLISRIKEKGWVDTVVVRKEYPDRLRIEVQTKRAAAIAVLKGQAYYLDGRGWILGRATPALLKALDLPVISWEREATRSGWDLPAMVQTLERFRSLLKGQTDVSQLVLQEYPYFKVYLSSPRVEVSFDARLWEPQIPRLAILLREPPSELGPPQKIDLIYPNKAVVTSPGSASQRLSPSKTVAPR